MAWATQHKALSAGNKGLSFLQDCQELGWSRQWAHVPGVAMVTDQHMGQTGPSQGLALFPLGLLKPADFRGRPPYYPAHGQKLHRRQRFQRLFSPWIQLCLKLFPLVLSFEPIHSFSAKACLSGSSFVNVSRKITHQWGRQSAFFGYA